MDSRHDQPELASCGTKGFSKPEAQSHSNRESHPTHKRYPSSYISMQ